MILSQSRAGGYLFSLLSSENFIHYFSFPSTREAEFDGDENSSFNLEGKGELEDWYAGILIA